MHFLSNTFRLLDQHAYSYNHAWLLQVLKRVAERGELVSVALNTHGTRAVQKLIETLSSREQRAIAIEALRPGVVGARVAAGACRHRLWRTGALHARRCASVRCYLMSTAARACRVY